MLRLRQFLLDDFNPRSQVESDSTVPVSSPAMMYFNPRSQVESDKVLLLFSVQFLNFNPRSQVESDL